MALAPAKHGLNRSGAAAKVRETGVSFLPSGQYVGVSSTHQQKLAAYCRDLAPNPQTVAAAIGCSRASLSRFFARQGESGAALIWARRLAHAHDMITSGRHMALALAEVGFCSGFTDQSAFTRTFRRRYDMTPGEARALALTRTA